MHFLFMLIVGFILVACQAAPATGTEPAEIVPVPQTPYLAPTITNTPAPTLVSTPTISSAELKRRAGPVCENAFSALVETGPLAPPFAVIKAAMYGDAPTWEVSHQLPHLGSLSAAQVRTLFCIRETREQVGTYADGSPAYQLFWDVRAVTWPGGKVIGRHSFTGSPPPKNMTFASGSAEGPFPYAEFAAWVFIQVDHPDFMHFKDMPTTLAVSPEGNLAAFGSASANEIVDREYQAKIFLFTPPDLQIIAAPAGHQGLVTSLAFSPDGEILASGGYDFFVKFWDVATSRLLGQVHIAETPNSLVFSPDGQKLAVASNLDVAFIDVDSMGVERSLQEASGRDLAYSPDGSQVYIHSLGSIKMIDPIANMVMLTFPEPFALVPTLAVSEDGSVVGVTYESPESVDGFALSPDGSQIITYTIDRTAGSNIRADNVRLAAWDAKTGKYAGEVRFAGDDIRTIEFSPNGNLLAIGNHSEVWLWDTSSWQLKGKLTGHVGFIVDLAFAPDGRRLLSAGSDGTIRVWSLAE